VKTWSTLRNYHKHFMIQEWNATEFMAFYCHYNECTVQLFHTNYDHNN